MKVKEDFLSRGTFNVGNGMITRFWEDVCLCDTPFSHQYPMLYNIAHRKQVLVANVFTNTLLNITFCRSVSREQMDQVARICSPLDGSQPLR